MRSPPTVVAALAVLTGLALVVAAEAPGAQVGRWTRPVDGPLLRAFDVGPDRFAAGQHRGVDLGAPPGARVLAACGGRVSFAGRVPRGGRTVSVRCGALVATYQHLGEVAVRRGQVVLPGARIGTVGSARPRPHVHLGARDAVSGAYVDPLTLIGDPPRAVPPPLGSPRRPLPLRPAPDARRPLPLGRTPAAVPSGRPVALGPAPSRRPAPLGHAPAAPRALPRAGAAPARPAGPSAGPRLPWPVWLGLALVALGLPLGGVVTVRRRRGRRAPARAPQPRTAA